MNAMTATFERDALVVIHDVARLMRTRFDQAARAYGMTRAQWVILARLNRQPGLSQNELGLARLALFLPRLGNRRDQLRPSAARYRRDVQRLPVRVQGVMPGRRFVRRVENWLVEEA